MKKVTWNAKKLIWSSIGIIFSLWLILRVLEGNGFCTRKLAFHPYNEQELIDKAIADAIKHIPSAIGSRDGNHIKIIRYSSVEEFKQKNPDCCTLIQRLPEGNPSSIYIYYGFVRVRYWEFYENNILLPERHGQFIPYNSCGEITRIRSLF